MFASSTETCCLAPKSAVLVLEVLEDSVDRFVGLLDLLIASITVILLHYLLAIARSPVFDTFLKTAILQDSSSGSVGAISC